MIKLPRLAILLALALAGVMVSSGTASAASDLFGHHGSFVVGHLYVNDNTAGANTIAAFDRHSDGTLTPTPGSPFAAGGAGTGSGIGSQGALQESADGRYLLAVDAGSSQISVLRIGHDGALEPVSRSPFSSDGIEPVSIAVNRNLVYVANAGNGGSNYTGFRLDPDGDGHIFCDGSVAISKLPASYGSCHESSYGDVEIRCKGTGW